MDYFEATVARILEADGYWVRQRVHVDLPKAVKAALGTPSMPRPEIDLVAFKPHAREVILFEVKSYLYSYGVQPAHLLSTKREGNRYKLLTLPDLQREVVQALRQDYSDQGLITGSPTFRFGLAAGFVQARFEKQVADIAKKNKWVYYGPKQIAQAVWRLGEGGYENTPFALTAKLLRSHPPKQK